MFPEHSILNKGMFRVRESVECEFIDVKTYLTQSNSL